MKSFRLLASKWKMAIVVLTSGMILPSQCEVRVHDAVIDATKSTFASLFDPQRVLDWFEENHGVGE